MERIAGRRLTGAGASRRLGAFAAVSLCLHAGVLLIATSTLPDPSGQPATAVPIEVFLIAPPTVQPVRKVSKQESRQRRVHAPAPQPEVQRARPERRVVQKRAPKPAEPVAAAAQAVPESPSTARPVHGEETSRPIEEAAARANAIPAPRGSAPGRVKALLLADLARYFEYPALAQRRGWQGTVLLSISVKPDGMLERIHVNASSGYAILDRSAIDTMRRIGYIAQAESWLNGQGVELLLPVVYRLTD